MKAKIEFMCSYWVWSISARNGCVICQSGSYTHYHSARRGLKRFLENFSTYALVELAANSDESLDLSQIKI